MLENLLNMLDTSKIKENTIAYDANICQCLPPSTSCLAMKRAVDPVAQLLFT